MTKQEKFEKIKNKLLAMAEIADKGNVAVLEKLMEFQDVLDENKDFLDKSKEIGTQFDKVNSAIDEVTKVISEIKNKKENPEVKNKITDLEKKLNNLSKTISKFPDDINAIKKLIPKEPDLSYLEDRLLELGNYIKQIDTKEQKEETAIDIKDKLESLKGADRLDKSAINGWDDIEKNLGELKKRTDNIQYVGSPAGGGKVVRIYDLSPLLDGLTKTFSLPAFWRITGIQSSSAPFAFIPTTDYTVDYSAMSITFTAQINAAATLAAGQTILVLYAEP